ncbi:unnamed protein product [Parajaminaea phylloscopi]
MWGTGCASTSMRGLIRPARSGGATVSTSVQRGRPGFLITSIARHAHSTVPSKRLSAQPVLLSTLFHPAAKGTRGEEGAAGSAEDAFNMLVRGGYLRQSSSGVFTFLAPGRMVLRAIENVIDEEMTAVGATRIDMPTLLPTTLWKKSARIEAMGSELFQLKDRKGSEFLLAPTHEEEVTKLVCSEVQSYKDLPVKVYQMTRKHRDEPRPRLGLLRTREFIMKDLYSFDEDIDRAGRSYEEVRLAYRRVMDRLFGDGQWKMAEADSGAMGGKRSHEFHVADPSGEDDVLSCDSCSYTANLEAAECRALPARSSPSAPSTLCLITDDVKVVLHAESTSRHPSEVSHCGTLTALVMHKDASLSEAKVSKALAHALQPAIFPRPSVPDGERHWDWQAGPEGPVIQYNRLRIVADSSCSSLAEEEIAEAVRSTILDFNTDPEGVPRPSDLSECPSLADYFPAMVALSYADMRAAEPGSACPRCSDGLLQAEKAIEVGHTFLLGTRYTESLGYQFAARPAGDTGKQERKLIQMGCYGLGVTRILGVLAIQARRAFLSRMDDASRTDSRPGRGAAPGLLWPTHLAPYTHALVLGPPSSRSTDSEGTWSKLSDIVADFVDSSGEGAVTSASKVLIDDRAPGHVLGPDNGEDVGARFKNLSLGSRLRDIDILGVPHVYLLREASATGGASLSSSPEEKRYTVEKLR